MEPRNIPEITPPTLLALSTAGSRVHHLTVGSLCTCIYIPPAPPSATSVRPSAVDMWDGGVFQRCAAPSDTPQQSPVREWLLKVLLQGSSRLPDSPRVNQLTEIAPDLPTQLPQSNRDLLYVTKRQHINPTVSYTKWLWGYSSITLTCP